MQSAKEAENGKFIFNKSSLRCEAKQMSKTTETEISPKRACSPLFYTKNLNRIRVYGFIVFVECLGAYAEVEYDYIETRKT